MYMPLPMYMAIHMSFHTSYLGRPVRHPRGMQTPVHMVMHLSTTCVYTWLHTRLDRQVGCAGHIICSVCRPAFNEDLCPTCRISLEHTSRALIVENMVKGRSVLCQQGCGAQVPYLKSREHQEKECALAPMACPYHKRMAANHVRYEAKCDFAGSREALFEHMKEHHHRPKKAKNGVSYDWKLKRRFERGWSEMFVVGDVNIWVQIRYSARGVLFVPTMLERGFDETTYEVRMDLALSLPFLCWFRIY